MAIDIEQIRKDFPILAQEVNNKPLVYLDNGATTQKPLQVIKDVEEFYRLYNSNIHRGVHHLSNLSTQKYEAARETIKTYINAEKNEEIIFTSGTTDAINLVAFSFGEKFVHQGDTILVAETEHHSNIVPWQMLCQRKNAILKVIPVLDSGELDWPGFKELLSQHPKLVAVSHVSNAFGTIFPLKKIIEASRLAGAKVLVDGAQGIQHIPVDVRILDVDFYAFSGHKIYAETGIGVLYAKKELLDEMPPYRGGGDMIKQVSFKKTTYADLPFKFEAGTANYVGAVSIASAIKYIQSVGIQEIKKHEDDLMAYAESKLKQIDGLKIYGTAPKKTASLSFLIKGIHPLDAGMVLDKMGIALRTGTHCAEPGMQRFGIDGTIRASFAVYNTKEDIDRLYDGLLKVKQMFS
ncbi:MAG: SufS family cysteine desulfurase [Bacteroidota bacterium]|nr:SufS family cysteine desulfurase [Bacteroidota bacterium]